LANASSPHPHPFPPPEREGKERPLSLRRRRNDYIPPPSREKLGGGWGFTEVRFIKRKDI